MWGLASHAAPQLDNPTAASSLAAAGLWEPGAGWSPSPAASLQAHQHLSVTHQQRQLDPSAWPGPPQPELHSPHHTASAKIYVQGLPQGLQHPVAVAGLFSPFGDVLDVKLYAAEVRLSGGSAVVRMRSTTQSAAAIAALNGIVPEGGWQQLTVRSAETAEQRSSRITAINGRQQGGGMGSGAPGSPLHQLTASGAGGLPPNGSAAAAALRRVHSARGASSQGSLQCYTGGLLGPGGSGELPPQRHSVDWVMGLGSRSSMDGSQRSSMDVIRSGAAFGRCSSDSGSGGGDSANGSDDQGQGQQGMGGSGAAGGGEAGQGVPPSGEAQRMLLEAVLALVGQVEGGQLTLGAMRSALENALVAAKQTASGPEAQLLAEQAHTQANNNNNGTANGNTGAGRPPSFRQ